MCWAAQVHALHVALRGAGFTCAEDDLRWWQFGDSTESVLQGFQVHHPGGIATNTAGLGAISNSGTCQTCSMIQIDPAFLPRPAWALLAVARHASRV